MLVAYDIKNDLFLVVGQYEAFRTGRRGMGYSEEELEESYGFLLFDDKNKVKIINKEEYQ